MEDKRWTNVSRYALRVDLRSLPEIASERRWAPYSSRQRWFIYGTYRAAAEFENKPVQVLLERGADYEVDFYIGGSLI